MSKGLGFLVYVSETNQVVHVDSDDIEDAARFALEILRTHLDFHVSVHRVSRQYSALPEACHSPSGGFCPPGSVVQVDIKDVQPDGSVRKMTIPMTVGVAKFHP